MNPIFEITAEVVLLGAATFGILKALMLLRETNDFLRRGTVAKAKVIKTRELYYDENGEGYYESPVLQFRDHRGQLISIQTLQQFDVWALHEEVSIVYDKKDPYGAKIVSYWSLYVMPIVVGSVSGAILINMAGALLNHLL